MYLFIDARMYLKIVTFVGGWDVLHMAAYMSISVQSQSVAESIPCNGGSRRCCRGALVALPLRSLYALHAGQGAVLWPMPGCHASGGTYFDSHSINLFFADQ